MRLGIIIFFNWSVKIWNKLSDELVSSKKLNNFDYSLKTLILIKFLLVKLRNFFLSTVILILRYSLVYSLILLAEP